MGHPTATAIDPADRPSLKAFQAEMEKTRNESGRPDAVATTGTGIEDKVKQLSIEEEDTEVEQEDGKTLVSLVSPTQVRSGGANRLLSPYERLTLTHFIAREVNKSTRE